ncbi:MAG: site-specific DNA-methyltransferase [Caulobacteraceae bacterium]|nr:site-specific DNA-methyltransferase [Caulobacteraceae bacterium]
MQSVTIGPCTLINADCRDVLPLASKVDAAVFSPPYNCGKDYGESGDEMGRDEYWNWMEDVVGRVAASIYMSGYLCINHGNYIGSRETRQYVPDELCPILSRQIPFVDHIIWDKGPPSGAAWGNFRTAPRIRAQHENIWVHGGLGDMRPSDIEWSEWASFTASIWRIPTTGVDASIHPAMMPIEVARRLVMLYSPAKGSVIDPFMGSGTTGIACIRSGRSFTGIEKDPGHFETSVNRIRSAWHDWNSRLPIEAAATQTSFNFNN